MSHIKSIAVIDDEKDIRVITKLALEKVGGFQVDLYASGKEALMQLPHTPADLILLDLMMPEMDGKSTLAKIRQTSNLHNIPVILLTAKVQAYEVSEYQSLGAVNVILKPFDPMSLHTQINQIMERYYEHTQ